MLKSLFAIVVLGMLSGCAIGLEHIDVGYRQAAVAQPIPGASIVPVELVVTTPTAPPAERVSVKKNGYGMEMGGIAATRPVADIVKSAFDTELRQRGFAMRAVGSRVLVDVTRFFNDYKTGFFTGGSEANVTLAVTVKSASGALLYARTVNGKGVEDSLLLGTPSVARQQLEKALADAVTQVVSDPEFIRVLVAAPSSASS